MTQAKGKNKIIIDAVLTYLGGESVYANQLCVFLLRKHTALKYKEIGGLIGDKTRFSTRHTFASMEDKFKINKVVRSDVRAIEETLHFYDN